MKLTSYNRRSPCRLRSHVYFLPDWWPYRYLRCGWGAESHGPYQGCTLKSASTSRTRWMAWGDSTTVSQANSMPFLVVYNRIKSYHIQSSDLPANLLFPLLYSGSGSARKIWHQVQYKLISLRVLITGYNHSSNRLRIGIRTVFAMSITTSNSVELTSVLNRLLLFWKSTWTSLMNSDVMTRRRSWCIYVAIFWLLIMWVYGYNTLSRGGGGGGERKRLMRNRI